MGFFEDSIVKAKDIINTAGEKGGEILSVQKLKIESAKIEAQIAKDFETLGRVVYSNVQSGVEPNDGISGIIETLTEKQAALASVNKKIADQKGFAICEACGKTNEIDAVFCSHCGASLHK